MVTVMTPPWLGHPLGPPMVVHCSAGIGRTGIVSVAMAMIDEINGEMIKKYNNSIETLYEIF